MITSSHRADFFSLCSLLIIACALLPIDHDQISTSYATIMAPTTGVTITLLAFSALGFWTLWGFPARNNLLHYLGELSRPGASIPGPTYYPMKQHYTGVAVLDKQLTTLVGFFYTAIDGNRIDITLSFLNLGSQVLAAWILITTESYRTGNKSSFVLRA